MKRWLVLFSFLAFSVNASGVVTVNVWHAYRAGEKKAIEQVAKMFNVSHVDIQVKLLPVPFDAINEKLRATIPLGEGPDVFIFAQDYVGNWAEGNLILPLEYFITPDLKKQYFKHTLEAFHYMYPGAQWALPSSFKNLVLFYNKDYVRKPPRKMSELIKMAKAFTDPDVKPFGKWGFVYETGNFYYHTMWIQGFGGRIFKRTGPTSYYPLLNTAPHIKAARYAKKLLDMKICPVGADRTLITQLFNTGNAMFVVNGQWFRGEISPDIDYGVAPLPIVDSIDGLKGSGRPAVPFLTVEGYFMSSCAKDQQAAFEVIKYFTSAAAGVVMAKIGKQTPANRGAYKYAVVKNDPIARIFREAARHAIPMPNCPEMALTWGPATSALNEILGGADPKKTLKRYQNELVARIKKMRKEMKAQR